MGRQFGFIIDENDKENFLNFVSSQGHIFKSNGESIQDISSLRNIGWFQIFFSKKCIEEIEFRTTPKGIKYIFSNAPVIEYSHTRVCEDEKFITRGRIWYESIYHDVFDYTQTYKDEELDAFYNKLVKWLKNNLDCVETMRNEKKIKVYSSTTLIKYIQDYYDLRGSTPVY